MLDLLTIGTDNQISQDSIEGIKKEFGLNSCRKHGSNYDFNEVFTKNGEHFFCLRTGPKFPNNPQASLWINPSRFTSHAEVRSIVIPLMGSDCFLNRIDFCSDLSVDHSEILARVRVKNKRKRTDYDSGARATGQYYGKRSHIIVIYDKAYQLQKLGARETFVRSKIKPTTLTRIEVRLNKYKSMETNFNKLETYQDYDPFKQVEIVDFDISENFKEKERFKAEYLRELSSKIGFHQAYKTLNSDNNFSKTWSRFVSSSTLNNQLRETHFKSLSKYFGE
tara:strand:+ start:113 stop:949 length:837 start_codon:yes stop_codon:yes gene_type:complete